MAMPDSNYDRSGLAASTYDAWHGDITAKDLPFYLRWIGRYPGPVLELACGTGRILLPLLQSGVDAEGLDLSPAMLAVLREKAERLGLKPRLHQAAMQDLDTGRKYRTILVPFRSFMLVTDRNEARRALERIRDHLEPGGQVLISLFVVNYALTAAQTGNWRRVADVPDPAGAGSSVTISESVTNDLMEQLKDVRFRFDLVMNGIVERSEVQQIQMRWYFCHEFAMMLERAGFQDVVAYGDFTDEPVRDGQREMSFRGVKGS